MLGMLVFIFSLAFSISIYAEKNSFDIEDPCYWCMEGVCTLQIGGTGWKTCIDASPGGNQCAFGGGDCNVDPGEGN